MPVKSVPSVTLSLSQNLNFQGDDVDENITEEMLGAASTLIREWAESLLGLKFATLSALARHLVDNLCVDTRSLAAVCILCATGDSNTSANKGLLILTIRKQLIWSYKIHFYI